MIIEPEDTRGQQLALNSAYSKNALRYLYALQLMVLIIPHAALAAAPRFTQEELDELTAQLTFSGSIYLADILEAILKHTTLEPLSVILSEICRLLDWGYHFTYYSPKSHTLSHLNKQVITALQKLREGKAETFAEGLADCYRYILVHVKKRMVEKYNFNYAANIQIPEKY